MVRSLKITAVLHFHITFMKKTRLRMLRLHVFHDTVHVLKVNIVSR